MAIKCSKTSEVSNKGSTKCTINKLQLQTTPPPYNPQKNTHKNLTNDHTQYAFNFNSLEHKSAQPESGLHKQQHYKSRSSASYCSDSLSQRSSFYINTEESSNKECDSKKYQSKSKAINSHHYLTTDFDSLPHHSVTSLQHYDQYNETTKPNSFASADPVNETTLGNFYTNSTLPQQHQHQQQKFSQKYQQQSQQQQQLQCNRTTQLQQHNHHNQQPQKQRQRHVVHQQHHAHSLKLLKEYNKSLKHSHGTNTNNNYNSTSVNINDNKLGQMRADEVCGAYHNSCGNKTADCKNLSKSHYTHNYFKNFKNSKNINNNMKSKCQYYYSSSESLTNFDNSYY